MKEKIKKVIRKFIYPNTHDSEAFISFLRSKGCIIGKGTYFFVPTKVYIDFTRPYLLKIGNYCKITSGVTILTHDYSRSVLRLVYGDIIGEVGETVIGDNVFIGMNAIILMNTKIGNNVIIGSGSVVTKDIPDNVVVGGNPAKIICTLEEYYLKRKKAYIDEAKCYARRIYEVERRLPTITEMNSFFPLFIKRDLKEIEKYGLSLRLSGDDYDDILSCFLKSEPVFNGFNEFLLSAGLPL